MAAPCVSIFVTGNEAKTHARDRGGNLLLDLLEKHHLLRGHWASG